MMHLCNPQISVEDKDIAIGADVMRSITGLVKSDADAAMFLQSCVALAVSHGDGLRLFGVIPRV